MKPLSFHARQRDEAFLRLSKRIEQAERRILACVGLKEAQP